MQHFFSLVNNQMFKLCWQKKKVKPLHYSDTSKMDILVHVNGNFIKKKIKIE